MDYIQIYYKNIIALVTELYHDEFSKTTPGYCMKITGLRQVELELLWDRIVAKYPHIDTFIVSENGEKVKHKYISATKLIEKRNSEEKPLLILVPANSRTAAEDSYGNATFKEISLEAVEVALYNKLLNDIPKEIRHTIDTIIKHPFSHQIFTTDIIYYLLFLKENKYDKTLIGKGLYLLHLMPDSNLIEDKAKLRSRLNLNMQSTDLLCNFGKPIYDRISDLPIKKGTIQADIINYFKKNKEIKDRNVIVESFHSTYKELDFSNWPIPDSDPAKFQLFVDDIISKEFILDEGCKILKTSENKSKEITVKIRTVPKPIELEEVKFFRLILMQVDGACGEEILELRKMKKSSTQQHFRNVKIKLNPNVIEEGTYFIKVVAEDESGSILNTHDKFKDEKVQKQWEADYREIEKNFSSEEECKEKLSELDLRYKYKRTSDSEEFDFEIDQGEVGEEPKLKKDKVKNRLQAYFSYRIDQLKKEELSTIPSLEDNSGLWLNDKPSKLNATYYLKYNNSHNYQINIPNKLRIIERMVLENKREYGHVEIITRTDASAIDFKSLSFKSSDLVNQLLPESILEKREELFLLISESSVEGNGIFETFDFYNHIDIIREYLECFTEWTSDLKEQFSNLELVEQDQEKELKELFIAIQNVDLVNVKMKLPNQASVDLQLLTPLHPLRLAWHLQLYDLFSSWENRTINFPGHIKEWKDLENIFCGQVFPENNPLAIISDMDCIPYQYAGELFYDWGVYIKPKLSLKDNYLSSVSRQIMTYLRKILNISKDSYIDTDISTCLIVKHVRNYILQHPYVDKLIINLFNAGDAIVFSNSLVELERHKELRHITYEVRLFRGEDNIINHGEGLKDLINPEFNISEEAESFSQQSENRLFPKLRFSVSPISDFLQNPSDYLSHLSFLVNLFPINTQLLKVKGEYSNFFMNGIVTDAEIQVEEFLSEIKWNRFIYPNKLEKEINDFSNIGIKLFANLQTFTAGALANKMTDSLLSTQLQLSEKDNIHISLVHDYSDWVITFDRHLGPQAFDQPSKDGYMPFLLDYIPGEEISGLSSFLTTRPNSEILGLLAPHFEEFNIDIINENEQIATSIILEDLRAISSSLVMQLNSSKNKAFEVIGSAFTKRVLEKKNLLKESFLIPIDLHQHLFNNTEFESKSRADNLLVRIDVQNRVIDISVIEIKCRTSLTEMDKIELKEKIKEQILNTIATLRYHYSPDYYMSEDRLDREIKNKELKSFLSFYIERAARYNYLESEVARLYKDFMNTLDKGFQIKFNQFGFIFDFSTSEKHHKEDYDEDLLIYTFGEKLISEILNPNSDLNTCRLEDHEFDLDLASQLGGSRVSEFIKSFKKESKEKYAEEELQKEANVEETPTPKLEVFKVHTEEKSEYIDNGSPVIPQYDMMVGKTSSSDQFGILGQLRNGSKIAIDLTETNTISLFGVQGGGKSYTIGTVTEMVVKQFNEVNVLPSPLASVIFHYSESMDYEPEFTSMNRTNDSKIEIDKLMSEYKGKPDRLEDIVILTPRDKVNERQNEYPDITVYPIAFNSMELNVQDWLFLLGAVGNDSAYVKQLKYIMKMNRRNLTLQSISDGIEADELLSNSQKALARQKINFAGEYIDDSFELKKILRPGRLIIVDLRDEFIVKDEALGLFVIMLNIFSSVKVVDNKKFNKFIVFDEAHKYMDNKGLTDNIVTAIREMRHKGVSIMIASQDPPSLPNEIIELSSIVITHKFNSPQWLKHIQKSITQLVSLQAADLAALKPGEAFIWATKATDKTITNRPQKIFTRPRVTKHGGETIKATR